jgi:hypothetical protein
VPSPFILVSKFIGAVNDKTTPPVHTGHILGLTAVLFVPIGIFLSKGMAPLFAVASFFARFIMENTPGASLPASIPRMTRTSQRRFYRPVWAGLTKAAAGRPGVDPWYYPPAGLKSRCSGPKSRASTLQIKG